MTAIPGGRSALDVRRPFTRAAALAAGITDRRLDGPAFQALFRGVHVSSDVEPTLPLRAEGALLLFPSGTYLSHATAAELYGVPVGRSPDVHVSIAHEADRRRRAGICCHRAQARTGLRWHKDLPISAPEQVFVELAGVLPLVELVAAGDHLVRRTSLTPTRLRAFCAAGTGRVAAFAATAATYVRAGVDSPMETRLRMLLRLAGLPDPEVNPLVATGADGLGRRKYDLCWPLVRLVVEYDGRHHVERVAQWESDLARREGIDDDGWRIIVVTASGIYVEPAATVARVHRALRDRRMPGTPPEPARAWRAHFPGRSQP